MEILGIGPSELIFIVVIALIILGPKDMQKAGKTIGKFMRNIVTSDGWKIFQQTSRELRTLPNKLMREANEEVNQINKDLNKAVNPLDSRYGTPINSVSSKPATPPILIPTPSEPLENKAVSPAADPTPIESDQQKDA
jgi:Sec-independent protein translocase protein TatA